MPQAGSVQGEQEGCFTGSVCLGLVVLVCWVFCFFFFLLFLFFFSLLKDTTSILLSESTNETIHRGTKFVSYSDVENRFWPAFWQLCVFNSQDYLLVSGF